MKRQIEFPLLFKSKHFNGKEKKNKWKDCDEPDKYGVKENWFTFIYRRVTQSCPRKNYIIVADEYKFFLCSVTVQKNEADIFTALHLNFWR